MKRLAIVALTLSLTGCHAFIRSFQGPPGGTAEPLIGVRSYPYQSADGTAGESVTVKVVESERAFAYCSRDSMGISCDFPSEFLMHSAALSSGGWYSITFETARNVCADAMWSIPNTSPDAATQCGWALVEMRWQEALPDPGDKNQ